MINSSRSLNFCKFATLLGLTAAYSFAADPVDGDITLTSSLSNPDRAILDLEEGQFNPNLAFSLSNAADGGATYSLTGTNLTNLSDPLAGNLYGSGTNPILGRMDSTGLSAGDIRTFTLSADPSTPDLNPVQASHDVTFVQNRQLEWTTASPLGIFNLGRHYVSSEEITVTLNGGSGTHQDSTDVLVYENAPTGITLFEHGNTTVYKQNADLDVFNDAGQSVDFSLFINPDGLTTRDIVLGNNFVTLGENGEALIQKTENLANESLQVTEKTITVKGSALYARTLSSDIVSTGERVMVGESGSYNGTQQALVTTTGSDETEQRLRLYGGSLTNGALASSVVVTNPIPGTAGNEYFDDGSDTATVDLTYTNLAYGSGAVIDTDNKGRKEVTVEIGSKIVSAEASDTFDPFMQTSLNVGVSVDVVTDRSLAATDRTAGNAYSALVGTTVTDLSNNVRTTNGSFTTNVGLVDGNGGAADGTTVHNYTDQNSLYTDSFSVGSLTQGGTVTGAVAHNGSRSFDITEEGLEGENAQTDVGFSWQLKYLAAATHTLDGGLEDGDSLGSGGDVTVNHTGTSVSADIRSSLSVDDYTAFSVARTDGNSTFSNGESTTFQISNRTGLEAGTYQARASLTLTNAVDFGSSSGDVGSYGFVLTHVVAGQRIGGSLVQRLLSGTSFGDVTVGLKNDALDSFGTEVGIIDSLELTEDVEADISFESADLAEGVDTEVASGDAVDISGLDGKIIVIQSTYDEADLISQFGTEDAAVLMWWSEDDEQWVNAVAGNSDERIGRRYAGSYEDYLLEYGDENGELTADLLGDFGWDVANDAVWAIVDHNSTFGGGGAAAVPEPSASVLLMGLACGALLLRRRR